MFKIGNELFTAVGPESVREVARFGPGVFLDLKFHDIPNTVAGAVRAGRNIPGVVFMNVHTLGGAEMMRAAAQALGRHRNAKPMQELLGVTILTSMEQKSMREVGIVSRPADRVLRLAKLAQACGLDGVIASPREAQAIRKACGKEFLIVTPGVRPAEYGVERRLAADDQARAATPLQAIAAGADYIVVGRPITSSADPVNAAEEILREIDRG